MYVLCSCFTNVLFLMFAGKNISKALSVLAVVLVSMSAENLLFVSYVVVESLL